MGEEPSFSLSQPHATIMPVTGDRSFAQGVQTHLPQKAHAPPPWEWGCFRESGIFADVLEGGKGPSLAKTYVRGESRLPEKEKASTLFSPPFSSSSFLPFYEAGQGVEWRFFFMEGEKVQCVCVAYKAHIFYGQ